MFAVYLESVFFSNHLVQVIGLLCRPSIIPEDRRANHLILVIQNNKSMHLPSKADTGQFALIAALQAAPSAHQWSSHTSLPASALTSQDAGNIMDILFETIFLILPSPSIKSNLTADVPRSTPAYNISFSFPKPNGLQQPFASQITSDFPWILFFIDPQSTEKQPFFVEK